MRGSSMSFFLAISVACVSVSASAQQLCPGLTGAARTNCLNATLARQQQETARIERNNRNLDRTKAVVCAVTRSSAAGAVGGALGDAALGQNRPCTARAQ